MGLTTGEPGKVALPRWQLLSLIGTAVLATGGSGVMVWKMAQGDSKQGAPKLSADEARLLAKAEEARLRRESEAKKLHQTDVGGGYQVDPEGNLTGPAENRDLPSNKSLDEMGNGVGNVSAEIAKGIRGGRKGKGMGEEDMYDGEGSGRGGEGRKESGDGEKVQRTELEKSMLGYSTVKTAKWAIRHADSGDKGEGGDPEAKHGGASDAVERVLGSTEKRLAALKDAVPPPPGGMAGPGVGAIGPLGAGPLSTAT